MEVKIPKNPLNWLFLYMLFYKPNGLLVYEAPKNPQNPDFGVKKRRFGERNLFPNNIGRDRKIKTITHTWDLEGDLWERRRIPLFHPLQKVPLS